MSNERGRPLGPELLEQVVDTLDDVVYVHRSDGELVYWNDRAVERFGSRDRDPDVRSFVTGTDEQVVCDAIEQTLAEGHATAEVEMEAADGTRVEMAFSATRLDANGETYVCGVGHDITDQRRRERELERYETAIEAVPSGVILVGPGGTMLTVNETWAEMVGHDPDMLEGEPFDRLVDTGLVDTSILDAYESTLRDLLSNDNDVTDYFDVRAIPPNDDEEHVYRTHLGLVPSDGAFRGAAAVVRDVTAEVTRREELQEKSQRLEEFASAVSHDLRSPLAVAKGYLDLARETGDSAEFDRVEDALDRIEDRVEDVLALTRTGELSREPVDIGTVARDAWQIVDPTGGRLVVDDSDTLDADPGQLRRLFENLFHNADTHAFGDGEGTVRIETTADGFVVSDDGCGLPNDASPFEHGWTTDAGGTGYGLTIVERIAESHGWSVTATESDEGGARFEITT